MSKNQFKRHGQVLDILSNPEHVGSDVEFVFNPHRHTSKNGLTVYVNTISPFLGRRALVNAAATLDKAEEFNFMPGSQLGLDFHKGPSTVTDVN